MQNLPTEKEQHWLLVSLAALIRSRGYEHFLAHPIVEPTREFFPDPWSYSAQGLDRVVRRLMQYAGLQELEIAIHPFSDEDEHSLELDDTPRHSVAGLFMGIEAGQCRFGFNVDAPADAEHMAGVMAHEVTHAYRAHHGLVVDDTAEEELLTDLTACYLGFGVLVANTSHRYRASGGVGHQEWSIQQVGYLTPQGFGFLLGLQLVLLDAGPSLTRRVLRHLEPNQAAFTKSAFSACQERSQDFPEILGIPPSGQLPAPRALSDIVRPLPAFEAISGPVSPPRVSEQRFNAGQPVFRLRRRPAMAGTVIGLFAGMIPGMVFAFSLSSPEFIAWFCGAGLIGGMLWACMSPYDVCAGAECGARLEPGLAECPNCGGRVMGSIRRLKDRYDAEETILRDANDCPIEGQSAPDE